MSVLNCCAALVAISMLGVSAFGTAPVQTRSFESASLLQRAQAGPSEARTAYEAAVHCAAVMTLLRISELERAKSVQDPEERQKSVQWEKNFRKTQVHFIAKGDGFRAPLGIDEEQMKADIRIRVQAIRTETASDPDQVYVLGRPCIDTFVADIEARKQSSGQGGR